MKTGSAIEDRIDDHALAAGQLAHHFVAHDERILRRNRAFVNLQVGPAQPAVRDAHQNVTGGDFGQRDV